MRTTLADRIARVRGNLLLAVQAGCAAGIAWYVAHNLLNHPTPFFAPIAAVIVLGVSVGRRLRRAIELMVGVALGIGVGDALIYVIGSGPIQIAVVVAMAMVIAVFVGGSATVVGQAASSAVLVATLAPPQHGIYPTRFVDTLVGGCTGVLVLALLLPLNPLTHIQRAAGPAMDVLAAGLRQTAAALRDMDQDLASDALERLRGSDHDLTAFRDALTTARETATLAPVRWRAQNELSRYVDGAEHLERAVRNTRVLARRAVSLTEVTEPVPAQLPEALDQLAGAVLELRQQLAAGEEPTRVRASALAAVRTAAEAYQAGVGFSGSVIVAQIRSAATDLLRVGGASAQEARREVRQASR